MQMWRGGNRGTPAVGVLTALFALLFAIGVDAYGHTETSPAHDPDCLACRLAQSQTATEAMQVAAPAPVSQWAVVLTAPRIDPAVEPHASPRSSRAPPSLTQA